jgi:hypothetical protein
MVTSALTAIYQALFEGGTTEKVYKFQQLAANSFTEEGREAFIKYLTELNGGADPGLTVEQIRAFGYLMKADQNANTAKPWADSETQIW